jgi:hypothetical protein
MSKEKEMRYGTFRWKAVLTLILITAVPWSAAVAQTTTATLRGTINDESGNVFPGAEITATNTATGYTHSTTAGNDGRYILAGLQPAQYRISVSAPSYNQASREVTLLVGQQLDMNFRLTPDLVVMEQITVIGTTPVEMETSEVATNVTRQQIEGLPQNDRNFLNFASLAPGVLLSTNELRKEIRAGAQGASAINVFIDGVSFKNDVIQGGVVGQDASRGNPFPQNAVQEFRVVTQNFSAEYQKASSAIVTAITKSGTNTLSGDGFILFQDKSLVDENPLTGADPEYERNQWGLSIGGPVIRDRMHFFGSYEANDQDREETVTRGGGWQNNPGLRQQMAAFEGTFVSPFRSDLFFGKLSFQPSASNLFDWSVNYRNETDIRGFGGETSRESAENVNNDVWGSTLRYQYAATTWLNEASLSYQDFTWNPTPLDDDSIGLVYEGLIRIGGRDTEQDIGQTRLALRDDLTFTGLRFGSGSHSLKVGGNIEQLDYTVTKFFEENPRFFFRSDISATIPYKARWGFGNPDMSADNTQYGIYGQDDWAVNERLTLNLGLRWDYETNMIDTNFVTPAEVRARLGDDFPAKYFSDGGDREPKTDMFQPRLGASYDLFGNSRTVIFGGVGRYYDRNLFNNTLDERFRQQHFVGEFFFSETGEPIVGQPAVRWEPRFMSREGLRELQAQGITGRPEVFLIENDTKVPYSDQFNVGVRQSFGALVGSLTYANTRSYNGFSYLWGRGFCCPQIDPAYSNVLISSDDVKTWYDAVFITLDRPFTTQSRYGFNVAYTWADAEQIGGDLFSLDKPTIQDWDRYKTPGTQRHRIVANGTLGIPWDVRLSTLVQYSSGDYFNVHDWSRTVNGQGFCFNCYTRRSLESPAWTTVDLRADKDFHFGRARVGVSLEAFNIFNEERFGGFNDFQGPVNSPADVNQNLGRPTSIINGSIRRYQIGLRFGF